MSDNISTQVREDGSLDYSKKMTVFNPADYAKMRQEIDGRIPIITVEKYEAKRRTYERNVEAIRIEAREKFERVQDYVIPSQQLDTLRRRTKVFGAKSNSVDTEQKKLEETHGKFLNLMKALNRDTVMGSTDTLTAIKYLITFSLDSNELKKCIIVLNELLRTVK